MEKTTAEKIAVMQAFADGKPIEVLRFGSKKWEMMEAITPIWDWRLNNYRVAEDYDKKAEEIYTTTFAKLYGSAGNFGYPLPLVSRPGLRAVIEATKKGELK